jgi:molecular chaperone DnaK
VLQGGVKDVVLLDVLPLSLGMETRGGLFTRIIERNSKLPLKKSTVFTTVADNQSTVELHVLQGERELAQYNHSLAKFELVGIPPAPRGAPQIEVAFQIDVNGIVSVSATDKRSGKQQAVKIIPSTGLSVDEIDRMVLEAKQSSAEDRAARELASLRFRLKEMLPIVTRRYYGSRWLLERPEKEKIERILDQAKAIPAETDNLPLLKGAIKLLGVVSATLSKAIHAGEALTTSGAANGALDSDTGVRKLVKSALENIEPSKDS